jgi:hypothetical protein
VDVTRSKPILQSRGVLKRFPPAHKFAIEWRRRSSYECALRRRKIAAREAKA